MVVLCFNFISCSDDDKEEDNNNIIVNPNAPRKRVKQITEITNDLGDCYIYDIEYNSDNRVSKVTTTYEFTGGSGLVETIEFEYSENKVTMRFMEEFENCETQKSFPLNSNGYIEKTDNSLLYSGDYITSIYDKYYEYDEKFNLIHRYVHGSDSYTFTYMDTPNIGNLYIPNIISNTRSTIKGSYWNYMEYIANLCGKPSPYLPKDFRISGISEVKTIKYESDKDGYITSFTAKFTTYEFIYEEVK